MKADGTNLSTEEERRIRYAREAENGRKLRAAAVRNHFHEATPTDMKLRFWSDLGEMLNEWRAKRSS